MRYIISDELSQNSYTYFVVLKSITEVPVDGTDALIVHKMADTMQEGEALQNLVKHGIKCIISINPSPCEYLKALLPSLNGFSYDDEGDLCLLEDEDSLNSIIDDFLSPTSDTSLAVAGMEDLHQIGSFIAGYKSGSKFINTPLSISRTETAITNVRSQLLQNQQTLVDLSTSARHVFENAQEVLKAADEQRLALQKQISAIEDSSRASADLMGQNALYMPPLSYNGMNKVLVVREVSPCMYLTSLLSAFVFYLAHSKCKKVRFLIIGLKGDAVMRRYEKFSFINTSSAGTSSLYDSQLVFIDTLRSNIVKKLLGHQSYEITIVIDRTYGSAPCLTGSSVKVLNAVGGACDLLRFNLTAESTIFPIDGVVNAFYTIPRFEGYSNLAPDVATRSSAYYRQCKDVYAKLCNLLGIGN